MNDGKPTRRSSDSVIDLFLSNPEIVPKISLCETLSYENVQSDHIAVLLELAKSSDPSSNEAEEKYLIGKTDYQLRNEVTEERFREWNAAADRKKWNSVEEMYTSFNITFDECRDAAVPKKTFKYNDRRTHPPWWNDNTREAKKKLNKAKRDFKRRNFDQLKTLKKNTSKKKRHRRILGQTPFVKNHKQ